MKFCKFFDALEDCPIIPAVRENSFREALSAPSEILFLLEADVISITEKICLAHERGKQILIHLDLMKGIGKDHVSVEFLASLGADGIISTKSPLIKNAKDAGMIAVQRFFALDSQGVESIRETLSLSKPDLIEIMPGIAGKVIAGFSQGRIPVIAGGLIEDKGEVTSALRCGAVAVSTGKSALWYL